MAKLSKDFGFKNKSLLTGLLFIYLLYLFISTDNIIL